MSSHQTTEAVTAHRRRLQVSWVTIAVLAIVIAYVDGFLVTAVQGAIGAIERNQTPFTSWLRESTLMVPVYFVAVLAAMLLARRWVGASQRKLAKLGATALLIIVISSAVGIVHLAANSVYDYRLQNRDMVVQNSLHNHSVAPLLGAVAPPAAVASTCDILCLERRSTVANHVRGVTEAGILVLLTNLVLVAFVLGLRGDRLWWRRETPVPEVVTEANGRTPVGAAW